MLNKAVAVTAMVAVTGILLPASSTTIFIETDCYRPSQGYGTCFIEFTEPLGADWSIAWQNGETSRIRLLDTSNDLEVWDTQNNQWMPVSGLGLCWDSKCVSFSSNFELLGTEKNPLNCLHPTLGEGVCQVEWVPETEGLRVYWSDNSIDHVLIPEDFSGSESTVVWSNRENDWVDARNQGFCWDESCLFIGADFFTEDKSL